ncbi:helix-turn-helix domain-containing protein [Kitasatospora sp. RB6PN24]|uniref:helix-turn-helix domain-containing protein n=1 Tax=Kitasatospora humi TaxID=2893891 RepID=UPI001E581D78|nr:helix-turn-helix transcriptional regulator [Kitasatospora humi]MCC9306357.1 helix-turn-helix domain-containing protein [Kitasatospora humi]
MAHSTLRRRQLGNVLRRLREGKSLTAEQVADVLGWSQTKVTRIENAQVAAKVADVIRLLDHYEVSDESSRTHLVEITKDGASRRGWWLGYSDALNSVAFDMVRLEADASKIETYEPAYVPGLCQTPDYARLVIERLGGGMGGTIEDQVAVRMARQAVLTRPNPVNLYAIIHESALLANRSRPDIMGPQLDKLLLLNRQPNVTTLVMPSSASIHPGMGGAMAIYGFTHRPEFDVVLIEGLMSSLFVEDADGVDRYRASFRDITSEAMTKDDSLAFITAQRDKIA